MQNYNKKSDFARIIAKKISTFAIRNQNLRKYDARTRGAVDETAKEY